MLLKVSFSNPDLNKLGGPVAIFKASSDAAKNGLENALVLFGYDFYQYRDFQLDSYPGH